MPESITLWFSNWVVSRINEMKMKFVDVKSFGIHCRICVFRHARVPWSDFIYMQRRRRGENCARKWKFHHDIEKKSYQFNCHNDWIHSIWNGKSLQHQPQHMSSRRRMPPSSSQAIVNFRHEFIRFITLNFPKMCRRKKVTSGIEHV